MGQAETAQDNFWNLIGMAGDTALRVRSGMRLGVNEDGDLSFMSSYAQIRLDVAEDGGLVISAAGEHELVSADGTLQPEPILCHSRAEIHLQGNVLQVNRGGSRNDESELVLEVRAKESGDEPPGKQHLGGAIDSLLKPWPEAVSQSEDLHDKVPEPELVSESEPRSEKPDLPPLDTVGAAPRQSVAVAEAVRGASEPSEAQVASRSGVVKRWVIPLVAVLVVIALWLLANNVADTQAPAPLEIAAESESTENPEAVLSNLPDESAEALRFEPPPVSSGESRPPVTPENSDELPLPAATDSSDASELPAIERADELGAEPAVVEGPTQSELLTTTAIDETPVDQSPSVEDSGPEPVELLLPQQPREESATPPVVAESSDVSDSRPARQPSVESQTQESTEAQPPELAVAESQRAASGRVSNPTEAQGQRVAQSPSMEEPRRILLSADRALAQGRLVEPPEANAYDLYSRVVALDPEIDEAVAGLQAVRQGLINRALAQLATGNLQAADRSLVAAAETGANPIMVGDLRNEVAYQIRIADAKDGEFETLYPFSELVVVAQRPPRVSGQALEGEVSVGVEFTVTTSGAVSDVEVLSEVPEDVKLAVKNAVSDWQFEPVLFNRRPIPVRSSLDILLPN